MDTNIQLTQEEEKIFNSLKQWRKDKATQLKIPPYVIGTNETLVTILKLKPKTLEDFSNIKGFGKGKASKFGKDIIAILASF